MTETARRLLVECGACGEEKIRVVPHGAPARARTAAARRAAATATLRGARERASGRFQLSTFGLLSPGKGLETAIAAMPAIVERHPEVVYVIAGRTHPDVARREGERYRLTLERRVVDLGLVDHVEFDDRFLPIDEIADLLAETDLFVTPYREARADLLGRAQLRDRGRLRRRLDAVLVRAGPARLGRRRDRAVRRSGRARGGGLPLHRGARAAGSVARPRRGGSATSSRGLLSPRRPRRCCARPSSARRAADGRRRRRPQLVSIRTDHLRTLVDDAGIVQHANGVIPNRASGYCVDDVARLAVVALELARRGDEQIWTSIVHRSLAFLQDATDRAPGCATSWGTTGAGSTSPTSATTSAGPSGRSARSFRPRGCPPSSARRPTPRRALGDAARRRVLCERAPTPRSGSPASTPTG